MKKAICTFILILALITPSMANANGPININEVTKINMQCQKIEKGGTIEGFHRTPPQIPNVYLDASTSTVYFENPCYECTLELVIPGTDTVVYTSAIEDGAETFQIPNGFIGTYELHIHRGNYCFWGEIEL